MATYKNGILGAFTGKVGTVVGVNWRGMHVMRSLPKKTQKPPSEAQLLQRKKFGIVSRFLNPIKDILGKYFGEEVNYKSRHNLATSYHLQEAVVENGSDFDIIFPKVLISKGYLLGFSELSAEVLADGQLHLTWSNNSDNGMARVEDSVLVVIYAPELALFQSFEHCATRADGTVTLSVRDMFLGSEVQLWAALVNDKYRLAAVSTYVGALEIS